MQQKIIAKTLAKLSMLLLAFVLLSGVSCDVEVKDLSVKPNLATPFRTNGAVDTFEIAFAVRDSDSNSSSRSVAVQGEADSAANIISICGSTGTKCKCDFFTDSEGSGQVSSSASDTTYEEDGNYLRCTIPGSVTASSYTNMRVTSSDGDKSTSTIAITQGESNLTLDNILINLSKAKVRKIFGYKCYINYLQKTGATTSSIDCTSGSGAATGNLLGLQTQYQYYLYSDNFSNNLGTRAPDLLYDDGTGTFCGVIIKYIDCTTDADGASDPNDVTLDFGIYNEPKGPFTKALELTSAPSLLNGVKTVYGYAAELDSTGDCPPGFEERETFTGTPAAVADSNLNSSLTDTRIQTTSTNDTMTILSLTSTSAGATPICTTASLTCTAPQFDPDGANYASATQQTVTFLGQNEKYCVLPSALLGDI